MLLTEMLLGDKRTGQEPYSRQRRIENPDVAHAPCICVLDRLPLEWVVQRLDEHDVGGSLGAGQLLHHRRREARGTKRGLALIHAVLEDHASDHHRHGHGHVPDEAESGGRRGGFVLTHVALESQERREEEKSASHAGGDLVANDLPKGGTGVVVNEQARPEKNQSCAGPDNFEIPAGAVDDNAGCQTQSSFGQNKG